MKNGSPVASSDVKFVLLFIACAVFLMSLWLTADRASAQNGDEDDNGAAENQYSASQNQYSNNEGSEDACPGAQVRDTFEGTGDQTTAPFNIQGERFRITSEVEDTSDIDSIFFSVTVNDGDGEFVTSISQEREGTESSFVNEGPGSFFLEIGSLDTEYSVTVEDCVGGTTDDDPQSGVVPGTIPNKPLANTGGETVSSGTPIMAALLGAAALSGAFGVAMLRLGRRRG